MMPEDAGGWGVAGGVGGCQRPKTYGDLLLRNHHGAVLSAYAYRHDVGGCDGLEGILWGLRLAAE